MLHGFLGGWLACLHVTQLRARAWHAWHGRTAMGSCSSLQQLSYAQLVGLSSLLYACVDAGYFLGFTAHFNCAVQPTMVSQTYPITLFGLPGTAIFTSAQALIAAKMYALMKDCSRGKQSQGSWKFTEKVIFGYAFISPALYMLGAVLLSPGYVWTFGNYLYLAETVAIGLLLVVAAQLIRRASSIGVLGSGTLSRVWKLWRVCGGAVLLGFGITLCGSEPLVSQINRYTFDTMYLYLMQGYYMYYIFAPSPQVLAAKFQQ
jgi:hypothetical protein